MLQLETIQIPPWVYEANSGGPRSRTRTESVRSTLLGRKDTAIICPRTFSLALDFGERDPRTAMRALLRRCGIETAEELKEHYALPGPMLCVVEPKLKPLVVAAADPERVLRDALLLGLATATFFDPERPVLWTTSSLTRRLQLFDMEGFYA